MSADTQPKCRYKSPKGRLGRVLRRRFELMSIVRPLALVPTHTRVLHNKHCAKDALAKAPTKVQWLFFGRSANCARPGTPPEISGAGVSGCALLPPPGAPTTRRRHLRVPKSQIQQLLRSAMVCEANGPPTASQLFWPPVPGEICRQPGRRATAQRGEDEAPKRKCSRTS